MLISTFSGCWEQPRPERQPLPSSTPTARPPSAGWSPSCPRSRWTGPRCPARSSTPSRRTTSSTTEGQTSGTTSGFSGGVLASTGERLAFSSLPKLHSTSELWLLYKGSRQRHGPETAQGGPHASGQVSSHGRGALLHRQGVLLPHRVVRRGDGVLGRGERGNVIEGERS